MDGYAGAHEDSRSDPSPEWPDDSGPDTGLEEPMWQLGLGSGGGGGRAESESDPAYPERPNEADCIYYLSYCGYGARCRFNHPRDRSAVMRATRGGGAEYPERAGQPICQFYMRTGTCKFGMSCKYHHPRHGAGPSSPATLNYYGYPFRPGEKECSYYVKTGQCKFGATCKFHHPQPAGGHVHAPSPPLQAAPAPIPVAAPSSYQAMQSPSVPSSQQYGVVMARPPLVPSYVQGPYGPLLVSPSMVPFPSWNPYQAPVSPLASSSAQAGSGSSSVFGVTQLSPSAPAFPWPYQPSPSSLGPSVNGRREQSFPERAGQPECQHYMRTGDCKYGSSCKYHHPPDLNASNVNIVLSPTGLPIRPGAPLACTLHVENANLVLRANLITRLRPSATVHRCLLLETCPSLPSLLLGFPSECSFHHIHLQSRGPKSSLDPLKILCPQDHPRQQACPLHQLGQHVQVVGLHLPKCLI
ncbi:hypothetical protein BT93_H2452 [Corymbia citriodora subsp. variegata]|nr:hypothetical protein BT93_H2452 [Corymbia citriodora subsp. variegata]KAF8017263.1 hypothetical protein BT93_H2452 [Corymbia citriodora subsp. variegata]